MAAAATAIAVVAGVLIGGARLARARAGCARSVLRIIDSTVAFPSLILALVIAAILGPARSRPSSRSASRASRASPASPRT